MNTLAEGPHTFLSQYFSPSCSRLMTSIITIAGYDVGNVLELHLLQTNTGPLPQSDTVSVRTSQLIANTMATVVRVNCNTGCAILKLYDPKAAYHSFLQRSVMGPFLEELDDEDSTPNVIPRTACHIRDEPDGIARFEAALWRDANKHFKTETEAYMRMHDLQGVLIPKLYAVVRVVTAKEDSREDEYLDTHGI
ncbi:hypothetical protein ACKLNR_011923 [Fusarium oxysporum f. sp. zingiberi]